MWLITSQGFYSAVAHAGDPHAIIVRSRCRGDLEALRRQIPGLEIIEGVGTDYR